MKTKLCFIIICIMFLSGCNLFKKIIHPNNSIVDKLNYTSEKIEKISSDIKESNKEIDNKANNIKREAIKIENEIVKDKITDNSNKIISESGKISNYNEDLIDTQKDVKKAGEDVNKINKDLIILKEERNKALEDAKSQTKRTFQYMIMLCVVAFGAAIALIIMGNVKFGIPAAIASVVTLLLLIVISQHLVLIGWIGMGIIGLIGLVLIYETFIQKKVQKELVESTEIAKVNMSDEERKKVFGEGKEKGLLGKFQSENTSKMVKKQKDKIGKLWEYAKNKNKNTN